MSSHRNLNSNRLRVQKHKVHGEIIIYTYIFMYLYTLSSENHFLIPEKLRIIDKKLTFAAQ